MSVNTIVQVNIFKSTLALTQAGFGTIAIVGPNLTSGRIATFSTDDLAALAAALDGGDSDPEYIAAQAIAQQSPKLPTFKVVHIEVAEDPSDALEAAVLVDPDFYGVILTSRVIDDVLDAAVWVESNDKLMITASAISRNVDTDQATDDGTDEATDSISAIINARGYERSNVLYHADAATLFPDAGALAVYLIRKPGSYTGMFKSITGFTSATLTPTYRVNGLAKNCNLYETLGGKPMIHESTMGSGEYFDVMHFIDWFSARMTEAIFGLLARSEKIPFTPEGLVALQGEMDAVGDAGIASGGLSAVRYDEDTGEQLGGYVTIMPSIDDISTNDRANRLLDNVKAKAWLAGAIHKVRMDITITL